ncbi:DNA-directed RNA polymerase subunit beta' [candidate division TA06 bacterium]|nr:DNA-directed RNA polymerase subunit beta' [candidate division TA06 bacterium]
MIREITEKVMRPSDFSSIRIKLASPEKIRTWSYGEVARPETLNYRTQKPEKGGLFCERIFGPVKDYECNCGKYKHIRFKGVICDRCGVEVTLSKVRRERMGHIILAVPVAHIWFYKVVPSRIGLLLDMSIIKLQRVLFYESYVVVDPGPTTTKKGDLLSEEEYQALEEEYRGRPKGTEKSASGGFVAKMGGEGIRNLLKQLDLEELSAEIRSHVRLETSPERRRKLLQRLRIVEGFRLSGNLPEWMIFEVLPVIPPDLRPLVPLEGGRFATSDLNDLYRRVITRNNRLKNLLNTEVPEIILRNEKRMLQEAIDALMDNSHRSRMIKGRGNRPLKSLADTLRGKQGRFRQNLLGKRVDYSGRSVIVVGPELLLHQCGLPKAVALELFKPFIIKKLEERGHAQSVKGAKRLLERESPEVWEILEEIVKDHPVLLNRAPTLHRLGIQAFQPVLIEGKAIQIHPLVCHAFNADFDGDQMAVHVPLSFEAQMEAHVLMLSINNILSPANGLPLADPRQDMVIGLNYLTKERKGAKGEGKAFSSREEIGHALENSYLTLHTKIRYRINGQMIETTVGRTIFNEILPEGVDYLNETLDKEKLQKLVALVFRKDGTQVTAQFLDRLKSLGFEYATLSGLTVGMDDLIVPKEKNKIIEEAYKEVAQIQGSYDRGTITDGERYNRIVDTWTRATTRVGEATLDALKEDRDGFNPIYMMADSGARGNREQVRQLAGMRGLMTRPQRRVTSQAGAIIESPITSNFREGLSVMEYFISTHGARKGLTDTALKTAEAGYLTRRLVDVAQDVVILVEDCNTPLGQEIRAIKEGEEVIEPLRDRILGRVTLEAIRNPLTDELIVKAGKEIGEEEASEIEEYGIESVLIRSVLTCEAKRGLCCKCYGRNLATGRTVELGEAVGVIGAQSIGEPGTQLTLRTFHIGGTAVRVVEQTRVIAKGDGTVTAENLRVVKGDDQRKIVLSREGMIYLTYSKGKLRYRVPYGASLYVEDGQVVKEGEVLFEWDPYNTIILTEQNGTVQFVDIIPGITLQEELDDRTGRRQPVVVEERERTLKPEISILDRSGRKRGSYAIPTGAYILVHDKDELKAGMILAKIPREISKTRDITGGLPRVAELFEARRPQNPAVVAEIDGIVQFGEVKKGIRSVYVKNETGEEKEYAIPYGKHLRIYNGERVRAGGKLSEGSINPHDILRIKGAAAVQEYLLNEIQEVYRLQGVKIDDKHIGIIVRQMLQKVRIEDPGDTLFIEGDTIEKREIQEENERVRQQGGRPATFRPLLLGITKAALTTQSFISAASFQETTRVLTDATIFGKRDFLRGLKENVIMGNLIPAGTGLREYRNIKLTTEEETMAKAG